MKVIVEFYRCLSPVQRSLIGAGLGFLVYGSWALIVNLMHGQESAIKAGLVQGGYSFVLTFLMTLLLEVVYQGLLRILHAHSIAAIFTVLISCSLVFSGSWYLNYLSGTPEIFHTVILGYVLGGLYSIVYTIGLVRQT